MALAAVSSVARILGQIMQHQHFIVENKEEVESLFKEVTSLEVTLQNSNFHNNNSEHIASLESQLVNAAYRARDIIETHIGEQIIRENNLAFSSYELFDEARKEIDVIAQELMETGGGVLDHVQPIIYTPGSEIWTDVSTLSHHVLWDPRPKRLCIVGIAGTGKTTITRHLFNDPLVKKLFGIRGWVTVSQSHDMRQILIDILDSIPQAEDNDMRHEKTTQQLQQHLHNALNNTSHLIVLDDLCDPEVLDYLSPIFPDNLNKSKILVTTRTKDVANCFHSSYVHWMTAYKQILRCQQLMIQNIGQVESLLKKVSLRHSSRKSAKEIKSLENQLINAENRAKDFSKYYLMEYKLTFSPQCLKGEIDLAKQLVTEIGKEAQVMNSSPGAAASIPPVPARNITAHDFKEIKNMLAEQSSKLEVVSLVGMAGIGKTTLARQVYYDKFFSESFLVRAWVTISQSYDPQKVLSGLLDSMKKDSDVVNDRDTIADLSERLYKSLKGWKYLIIIDDVWDTGVWDDLRRLFPDDSNASRILLTTRLENVAVHANSCLHHVHFMNDDESWNLFCCKVFGEDSCPSQLVEIGKQIVRNCQGLPLAIVVIGGLLFRATRKPNYWRNVCESLSSSNGNDHCLQILSLSYTHLCDHMKKCFLYVGIFPEDSNILVSRVVKKWVAEGLIESRSSNRLKEDIAYETLLDLISRNLLLVDEKSSTGKIKRCKIHDLVREFCMREAQREMLFHITDMSLYGIPVDAKVRFLSIHPSTKNAIPCDEKKLSSLRVNSLQIFDPDYHHSVHHLNFEPLRVLDMGRTHNTSYGQQASHEFLSSDNLRYLSFDIIDNFFSCKLRIPSSSVLPELQTLILCNSYDGDLIEFPNIWNMAQLRHVKVSRLCLFDPVEGENSGIVLENLQTLSQVYNFRWSRKVLGRIPNMRKLGIMYASMEYVDWEHYCLQNINCLQKLEALTLNCSTTVSIKRCPSLLHICSFPPSLKKLTLEGCRLPWKDMKIIGGLPNVEVLKLRVNSFMGKEWEWESTEEEFPKLKYLLFSHLDIELWRADSVSFPSLQCLIFSYCKNLTEAPHCIGQLPTLQFIQLDYCSDSLIDSVKKMQEEQMELGYDGLEVRFRRFSFFY